MNDVIPLFGFTTTPLELVSFLLAATTVILDIRQVHWAWLFAILSSATYAVVFFGARLYGDMALQFVFIVVSAWGWHQWLRGGAEHRGLRVTRLGSGGIALAMASWLLGFLLIALFLRAFTDTDVPWIDGFLTSGSLVGQLLLSRKKLENWHVWIVVDLLYVGLYLYKNLMLTAILYGLFVLLALVGLRAWRDAAATGEREALPA
ncbi:MAG TPA: nicotinamide riboside transporter PnuC [Noviherbaspirillum sp.]|jgi:nicotinamide mononucleotide transporter|uniref:nicotinamide riboside transporter PnuC n=1 Tax=Noviherbaspirillum sp. TaxID=1926288 RepID=UPI002F9590FD